MQVGRIIGRRVLEVVMRVFLRQIAELSARNVGIVWSVVAGVILIFGGRARSIYGEVSRLGARLLGIIVFLLEISAGLSVIACLLILVQVRSVRTPGVGIVSSGNCICVGVLL